MKTFQPILAALAFFALSFSSCLGPKVDTVALFEPAALAWPAVEEDVEFGLAAAEEENVEDVPAIKASIDKGRYHCEELGAALLSKDRSRLRLVPWPSLEGWAIAGISSELSAGAIGPGVAESLREQLSKFSAVILRLQEP